MMAVVVGKKQLVHFLNIGCYYYFKSIFQSLFHTIWGSKYRFFWFSDLNMIIWTESSFFPFFLIFFRKSIQLRVCILRDPDTYLNENLKKEVLIDLNIAESSSNKV